MIFYHFLSGTSFLYLFNPNLIASANHHTKDANENAMISPIMKLPVIPSLNPNLNTPTFPRTYRIIGINKTKSLNVTSNFAQSQSVLFSYLEVTPIKIKLAGHSILGLESYFSLSFE